MAVVHKNIRYQLPTCVISSSGSKSRGSELVCVPGSEQCSARVEKSNDRSFGSCSSSCCSMQKARSGGAKHVSDTFNVC